MRELKKRLIISGQLIAFIVFLLVSDHYFLKGITGFYFILALFSSFAFYEFTQLYRNINIKLPYQFPIITGLCGIIIIYLLWTFPRTIILWKYGTLLELLMWDMPLLISLVVFIILATIYYLKRANSFSDLFILFFGFVYIYLPVWSIARIRGAGIIWVVYFIALVKLSDTIAYFAGSFFGRHKLAERISPNKTVEGFIWALIGSSLVSALLFYLIIPVKIPFWLIIIINFIIVFIAQAGDLFESYLKRRCDVKDSGNLLGPLGGVLDLLDSLLLSAPVAAFLFLKII
jgi:phosphatidate cytidylyltransferase